MRSLAEGSKAQFQGAPFPTALLSCSRHPVRHLSFTSHSLITANVPYERVVRNTDLDNFTAHRRSVRWGCRGSEPPARVFSQARPF